MACWLLGSQLFGLAPDAARLMGERIRTRTVHKQYLAVVRGYTAEQGRIEYACNDGEHAAAVEAARSARAEPRPDGGETRIDDQFEGLEADAPACDRCGSITVRNGACYRCYNCGNSMGCS